MSEKFEVHARDGQMKKASNVLNENECIGDRKPFQNYSNVEKHYLATTNVIQLPGAIIFELVKGKETEQLSINEDFYI